jgi:plastocyanin
MSMKRVALLGAFVALLSLPAFAVAATGTATIDTAVRRGDAQVSTAVAIIDLAFEPATLLVGVGSTVTWTNAGALPHTVSSDTGAFDSGILSAGGTFETTFTAPGLYAYHCLIHPAMLGTVQVN